MICCEKCFCDSELIGRIKSLRQYGDCSICGSTEIFIYNSDINTQLIECFDEFLNIYTPIQLLPDNYPKSETFLLKDELFAKWGIFNNLNTSQIYEIITKICKEKYQFTPELFDYPVMIEDSYNLEYLKGHSILRDNSWENFVTALKRHNRFHTNIINLDILKRYCSYIRKPYKKGTLFYRGRISTSKGLICNQMGAPTYENASAGRANAQGIRCLYLANDIKTTIHEVRAGAYEYISVGTFELQEDIIVVNLKSIDKISPFLDGLDYKEHAINKEHLKKINKEMGQAIRKSDSALDYVPTQYISDFIKSIEHNGNSEYAGIEYNSTMNPSGYNLAIFNPDLYKCIDVKTYWIERLNYFEKPI
ncbi:RES family NAD+ phosphorylase [Desulfuribacillus alkaliarsenatis]|uniref:RES domain-containing protein n=1 Tax=Desulfuribacillus alkaliarsenatis TaxID=766136 RepID=A0A1E5G5A5_9FIRM|nr:RES family NAD+ phosphorylase [Desulfuribacillus alkaliarsenatis]OEF97873.1 hypothetical protein BHF68_13690 [Desulfuribacillus alkaliarsenatis]